MPGTVGENPAEGAQKAADEKAAPESPPPGNEKAPASPEPTKNPLQMAATGNGFLDASPSVLTFDGVPTSGKPLRAVLMIRNTTMRTLRLKIRMPMTDQFQVSPSEVRVVLAGGLRYKLRIACRPWDHSEQGAKQSRHDRIQFVLANGRFSEIKLHAYAPRALFEMPTHLDVGKVLQDAGCRRVVLLRNVGTRTGDFKFGELPDGVKVDPVRATVEPGKAKEVAIMLNTRTQVSRVKTLDVTFGSQPSRHLTVAWTVFRPRFELVDSVTRTPFDAHDFGIVYYGQSRKYTLKAVNNSPCKVSFAIEKIEDEKSMAERKLRKRPELYVFPANAVVDPNSEVLLECWFKPRSDGERPGFRATQATASENKDYGYAFQCTSSAEGIKGNTVKVELKGCACEPSALLEHYQLDFGDVPANSEACIETSIRNRSQSLSLPFKFSKCASFRTRPSSGVLRPMETRRISISFRPSSLGTFKNKMEVVLAKGLSKVAIDVRGRSEFIAPKRTFVGGTRALPGDFKSETMQLNPEQPPMRLKATFTRKPVVDYNVTNLGLELNKMPKFAGYGDLAPEMHYTYTPREFTRKLEHRAKCDDYLKQTRRERLAKAKTNVLALTKSGDPFVPRSKLEATLINRTMRRNHGLKPRKAEADIGMEFAQGLREPKLPLPAPERSVKIEKSKRRRRGGKKGKRRGKRMKKKPTTQAEMAECKSKLDHDDLLNVLASPKLIDMGEIYIGASVTKEFMVENDLNRNILIELKLEDEKDLRKSSPHSMMIPPGDTGYFDITLEASTIGEFRRSVYYVLNDYLTFNFVVTADVIPMTLGLSKKFIQFQFDPFSIQFSTQREVILSNPSNMVAHYWYTSESDQFKIVPMKGAVKGGQSQICIMTWTPGFINGTVQEYVYLHVKNGGKTTLSLEGIQPKCSVAFDKKVVAFETVGIGGTVSTLAKIKNTGKHVTVFKVESVPMGVTVEPTIALLQSGDRLNLTLTYSPKEESKIRDKITFKVRGYTKLLELPIEGQSVLPDVRIIEEELNFGVVELGNRVYQPLTIENRSEVKVSMTIDLAWDKEYSLKFPTEWANKEPPCIRLIKDDESNAVVEEESNVYEILLDPNSVMRVMIQFFPKKIKTHAIELPISVRGVDNYPSLRRVIRAVSRECKITANPGVIDFGREIVIDPKEATQPYYREVKFTNQERDKKLGWKLYIGRTFASSKEDDVLLNLKEHCFNEPESFEAVEAKRQKVAASARRRAEEAGKAAGAVTKKDSKKAPKGDLFDLLESKMKKQKELKTESGWKILDERMAVDLSGLDDQKSKKQLERLKRKKQGVHEENEMGVWVDDQGREIFWVSKGQEQGIIDPGETVTISVFFNPLEAKKYDNTLQLVLIERNSQESSEQPYLELPIQAIGYHPMLTFDQTKLSSNPVPLGFTATCDFQVINHGYPMLEVDYKLPSEESVPLDVTFPKGRTLTKGRKQLDVRLRYASDKPVSFLSRIDFVDRIGTKFPISVTGTSDNSLLTLQGFLLMNKRAMRIEDDAGILNIVPRERDQDGDGKDSDSDGETTYAATEDLLTRWEKGSYLWATVSFLIRFLPTLSKAPGIMSATCQNYPHHFALQGGKDLMQLAETLSGKKVPQPEEMSEGKSEGERVMNRVLVAYQSYDLFLNFLKSFGGLVNSVQPEFLLHSKMFGQLLQHPWYMKKHMKSDVRTPQELGDHRRRLISVFEPEARRAWTTVLHQMIRCFVLVRVSPKTFKAQPGVRAAEARITKKMSKSNVYTQSECILLRWLEYHYNKLNAHDPIQLITFDKDVNLSVIGAVIISHCPWLESILKITKSKDLVMRDKAVQAIMASLKQLGLNFALQKNDFLKPIARDKMLLVLYLYENLPTFAPKAKVTFEVPLGDSLTKCIELKNTSRKEVVYYSKFDGSPDFSIEMTSVVLAAKGKRGSKVDVPVTFVPRFTREVTGRLMFTCVPVPKRIHLLEGLDERVAKARLKEFKEVESPNAGALSPTTQSKKKKTGANTAIAKTLVFQLRSSVPYRLPAKVHKVQAKLYDLVTFDIDVRNPFPVKCDMMVEIKATYKLPKFGSSGYITESNNKRECNNCPFYVLNPLFKIKAGETRNAPIKFQAFTQGKYTAEIIFLDSKVGELMHRIEVDVVEPSVLPERQFYAEFHPNVQSKSVLRLQFTNMSLENARQAALESLGSLPRSRQAEDGIVEKLDWCADENGLPVDKPIQYSVKCDSPFFEFPQRVQMVAPGLDGGDAKDSKKAGQDDDDDDEDDDNQGAVARKNKGKSDRNALPFTVAIREVGVYKATLTLTSTFDVRVIPIVYDVRAMRPVQVITLQVPCMQSVGQEIPITNTTQDETWEFLCNLDGKYMRGPAKLTVPPGETVSYHLSFHPSWVCEVKGSLNMMRKGANGEPDDKRKFELIGKAIEPIAQSNVTLRCKARERKTHTFQVQNPTRAEANFKVESDLPNISGAANLIVPGNASRPYKLTVAPISGGDVKGSVSFVSPDGRFVWHSVHLIVDPPDEVSSLELSAVVRKATAVEIPIINPLNEPMTFDVTLSGDALYGEAFFELGPKEQGIYEFVYSPIVAGSEIGNLSFFHERAGEFTYTLQLDAKAAEPLVIDDFKAKVGARSTRTVTIENTLNVECEYEVFSSNPDVFGVVGDDTLFVGPDSKKDVEIWFAPDDVGKPVSATVKIASADAGEWVYNLTGSGEEPDPLDAIEVRSPVNVEARQLVVFKNPFQRPLSVHVSLHEEKQAGGRRRSRPAFTLVDKRRRQNVPANGSIQIAYAFKPSALANFQGSIEVRVSDRVKFIFPLLGRTEAPVTSKNYEITTQARTKVGSTLELRLRPLEFLSDTEVFTHEIQFPEEPADGKSQTSTPTRGGRRTKAAPIINDAAFLRTCVKSELVSNEIQRGSDTLKLRVSFDPLRPIKARCQIVILKKSGGCWTFKLDLEATEPKVDDTLLIRARPGEMKSIAFGLNNMLLGDAPFEAFFAKGSPRDFFVTPARGILRDETQPPTKIIVSFSPREYGKSKTGKLIIQTNMLRWTYLIRGDFPKYTSPKVESKLKRTLGVEWGTKVRAAPRPRRNFLRENTKAVRTSRTFSPYGPLGTGTGSESRGPDAVPPLRRSRRFDQ